MTGNWPYANLISLKNKTRILPSCSYVNTIVWLHYQNLKKKLNANQDDACCSEQVLEAVWLLAFYLTNHPNKTNKGTKEGGTKTHQFSCRLSHMDTPVLADQQRPIFISYVQTLDAVKRILWQYSCLPQTLGWFCFQFADCSAWLVISLDDNWCAYLLMLCIWSRQQSKLPVDKWTDRTTLLRKLKKSTPTNGEQKTAFEQ